MQVKVIPTVCHRSSPFSIRSRTENGQGGLEHLRRFFKVNPVFLEVDFVLCWVPFNFQVIGKHDTSCTYVLVHIDELWKFPVNTFIDSRGNFGLGSGLGRGAAAKIQASGLLQGFLFSCNLFS